MSGKDTKYLEMAGNSDDNGNENNNYTKDNDYDEESNGIALFQFLLSLLLLNYTLSLFDWQRTILQFRTESSPLLGHQSKTVLQLRIGKI